MASSAKGPGKNGRQPSIKHSCNLAEAKRKLSKISDHHSHVEYAYAFKRDNRKRGETKLSQILSRDALISAVDLIWDRSDFVSGDLISSLKEGNLDYVNRDDVSKFKVLVDSTPLPADQKDKSQLPSTPQPRVRLLGVAEKMYSFDPYNRKSLFNQTDGAKSISGFCKENGILFEARWKTLYSWMGVVPTSTRYHEERAEIEKSDNFEDRIPNPVSSKAELASRNADSCDCVFDTTGAEGQSTVTEPRSPLLASVAESVVDTRISRSSDANYLFLLYKNRCANNKGVNIISSKCSTDSDTEVSSSGNNSDEDSLSIVENKQLLERDRKGQETEVCSPSVETPTYAFVAKQRHAFAGALAGISVSLCLHPLDTVKTMIQSCRLGEKSLCNTGRSIISERGFSGLYRGIASNIASSAPISALYTFTYETVKGTLLPLFPKEYCSLTHCLAGGSASIATSFIFTPSERIKQQMQVSSHYRNCWTALVGIIQKGGLLSLYAGWTAVLCRNIPHSIIKKDKSQLPSIPQPRVRLLGVAEKMYSFDPYNRKSLFNQSDGAKSTSGFCKENGILFESRWKTLYSWMEGVVPTSTRYHEEGAEIEKIEHFEDRIPNPLSSKAELASRNANSCDCVFDITGAKGQSTVTEPRSPLLASVAGSLVDTRISRSNDVNDLSLLCKDRCANNKGVNIISSKCSTDCVTEVSSSGNNSDEDSFSIVENKRLLERDRKGQETEVCSSSVETPTYAFVAKQRHAFAGALAGISVSLCLHPLDTVKTMIQSCRLGEKSLCNTGRSIISERGFSGLYRGIASNIASSAPISALYTFTYETVKGTLLPLFPKEYCSLTHCLAGGSASIATSFIFTPSERIKQQMQVSSHYRNCWTALVGIIQKGGLLSLYAGWTAVLCRNIPHSIIKFYVYENMKQMVLPSIGPCGEPAQPTTLQTLTCGGLAGSAAAFFTTPFDVVKTRLQTQIPGSRNQHPSVYQTLQSIRKQEGLRGLYRGLIPRLVMYMSQGAIFFASYEFYKSVLSLEAAQPNSSALSGTKQKMEIAVNR